MMEGAGALKRRCVSSRLHGVTTENIFGVRSEWCAQDKQQQLSHTLSKLRFIQSIRVKHCAQEWDMSCKNVLIAKSNYCSWPAWPWRQTHYNPLKCWELLAQQHSLTILQTGIYSIQDSCWPRTLRSHVLGRDSVQFDRRRCLRGRNHLQLHGQLILHTIPPQQTVTHAIPTVLPVLFNALFLLWYLYVCLQSSNTVAWFYLFLHTVLRYCHYQYRTLYIYFASLNLHNLYFSLVSSHWRTEPSWNL